MSLLQIVQIVYSVSAIGLWAAVAALAWRYVRPALALGVDLVAALTRVGDAMKVSAADAQTTRETATRIEGMCERIEHDVREVRVLLAGRGMLASVPEHPESEPAGRRSKR